MTPKRLEVFRLMMYALAGLWIGYLAPNLGITVVALLVFALCDMAAYRLVVK